MQALEEILLLNTHRNFNFMEIYKVFRKSEIAEFEKYGFSRGSQVDIHDGYIHFSCKDQLLETIIKHFTNEKDLTLLVCDTKKLGDKLIWEKSRGNSIFPHLYRTLYAKDIKRQVFVAEQQDSLISKENL